MSSQQHSLTHQIAQDILQAVTSVQNGSGYGSVEIILHEGKVTLIEKREKLRLAPSKRNEGIDAYNNASIK